MNVRSATAYGQDLSGAAYPSAHAAPRVTHHRCDVCLTERRLGNSRASARDRPHPCSGQLDLATLGWRAHLGTKPSRLRQSSGTRRYCSMVACWLGTQLGRKPIRLLKGTCCRARCLPVSTRRSAARVSQCHTVPTGFARRPGRARSHRTCRRLPMPGLRSFGR